MAEKDDTLSDEAMAETVQSGEHEVASAALPSSIPVESERYQMVSLLGRGGMGEVHKAFDPRLGRYVALKLIRGASPEQAVKLMSEARAQARVEHANVCKIYGIGELDGMPFLALQFIDGPTLREASAKMTREERVRVMRDVADALHAAHRQGLVHRDVKPANILVEPTEAGWKPYVTDFGLAREVDMPGLTETGVAQGTPLYMAPEQARGDTLRIDRRTDVYAMGVVLYELLCGRRPFEGATSIKVILQLMNDEPPTLRAVDASVPIDLETITMKCLEKDPARRYESARALADDLQSWLNGDPIQARRASVGYRLGRGARKHAGAIAATVAVVLAASVGGIWAMVTRRHSAEKARLAEAFGQEIERNDAISRYSALLPLHDTGREREMIAARMRALEARMGELGAIAEGPGHYALGRGWLALGNPAQANAELDRAAQAGYQTPEVHYARGLALGQLYQQALADAARGDANERAAKRAELEKRLRDPARAELRASAGAHVEAPEYVEGLIAMHERRYEEALAKARAAEERVPWLWEAHALEGDIRIELAKERWDKGEAEAALAELERAGASYRAAAEIAHSSASALGGDCRRSVQAAEILADRDRAPDEPVHKALDACSLALVARPGDGSLYADQARAYLSLARYRSSHNGDPAEAWVRARELGEKGVDADPKDPRAQLVVAETEALHGKWDGEHGVDPRARIQHAVRAAEQAIAADPRTVDAYTVEANALIALGDWEGARGLDPRGSYDEAAKAGERAHAIEPGGFLSVNPIGLAWLSRGMWEVSNGVDPTPSLMKAAAIFEKMAKDNPHVDYGPSNVCSTYIMLGEYQIKIGADPTATLARAGESCDRSIAIDPNWAGSHLNVACVHYDLADWLEKNGRDPRAELALADAAVKRTLAVDHHYEFGFRYAGKVALLEARWAMAHGESPAAAFAEAQRQFERALEVNAKDPEPLRELAETARWRATFRAAHKQSVDADVKAGLQRARESLALNPRNGEAALQAGALELIAARAAAPSSPAQLAAAARAAQSLERALGFDANLKRAAQPLYDEAKKLAWR